MTDAQSMTYIKCKTQATAKGNELDKLTLYVYVYMHVQVHVWVHIYMCVHACGDQRTALCIVSQSVIISTTFFHFLGKDLSLAWS